MKMHEREANAQRRMLDVSGTRLAVTTTGHGPAIVCLHAIAHGARDFAKLAAHLGNRFTFVAVDFPAHGDSPAEAAAPTAQRYEALLGAAVDALGLTRFALLGCSIGGAAALHYAAAHPERVTALILCNAGGLQRGGVLARLVCNHFARFFARGERGDRDYARKYRHYYERTVLPQKDAAWRREEIIADAHKTAGTLRAAWLGFAKSESDIRHLPRQIRCPVLYAWCEGDRINAWSRSKRAALSAPNHTVKLFKGGHAAFLEQPEAFEAALIDFMERAAIGSRIK
jgi:4,5:9,10-diseco-3-hydroxy-5,9,17-trioxoandrosta-1(10),2-diene-4-oate hydrolase